MDNRKYQRQRRNSGPCLLRSLDAAILVYAREQGCSIECAIRDALTDLRHISDIHRQDFANIDDRAHDGYVEELAYCREFPEEI